jgi:predicted PurR-regulated permease PerM
MEKISVTITTKTLWTILLMVAGVFVAWHLRNFIMVILVSVIIASFIEAGTRILKRIKIPRVPAVFFLYISSFAIIAGVLYLFVPLFLNEIVNFIDLFPKNSYLVKLIGPLADQGFTSSSFKDLVADKSLISGSTDFVAALSGIFGGVINAMLVIIISFYLSIQEKGVEQFLRVITPERYEEYIVDLWTRVDKKIGYWFGGQMLVAILVGLITYVGLFFMSVPYALILSAVTALLVFVPFGTALSMAPAVTLGYLSGGISLAVQIFIFYGIVHYIELYFFTPYILHRTIGMPMLVIILSVIACVELFGLIGVVVAVPIAVLLLELIYDHGKFSKFKGLGA